MENHVLNENLKRLEPISKECAYCGHGTVTNIDECYYGSLFKVNDRTNIIVYSSVKYSKIEIGVPRCSECAEIHGSAGGSALVISFLLGILIFVLSFIFLEGFAIFIVILVTVIVGIFFNSSYEDHLIEKKGIQTAQIGFLKEDTVRMFMAMGWSTAQPTA